MTTKRWNLPDNQTLQFPSQPNTDISLTTKPWCLPDKKTLKSPQQQDSKMPFPNGNKELKFLIFTIALCMIHSILPWIIYKLKEKYY